jgi:alpha-N-arabinofuranosidase
MLFVSGLAAALATQVQQSSTIISVDASRPGAAVSPGMFGIFFEDINFGADGGLYPERIKNRSFEFSEPLAGWHQILAVNAGGIDSPKGAMEVRTDHPLNPTNPHYLRLTADDSGFGISNSGFRGIGVENGAEYRLSAYVRATAPNALRATLTDETGNEIGSATLTGFNKEWKRFATTIRSGATSPHAQFNLFVDKKGSVDLDMISLFPVETWNRRPNGLRKDLVQLLHDMHPGFIRFPGGCIVEGRVLATRYRWKNTIGDIAERKTIINRWNDEFDARPAPDYFESFGLGFYEYFQLAEDIGAKPLPILNCGMACEFNSSETVPLDQIHEYIQDALDLVEFANGPATSPWGKLRAQMGHPASFQLSMIGVGNEQWGPHYLERYKLFAAALKAKYPEIQLVVSAGPSPSGQQFDYLWSNWRKLGADMVDEHYYMSPEWFRANTARYDHYDRSGPKVFAGEYAAQTSGAARSDNRNNWNAAISEAAFMTGLERNGDVVRMASYAPLLANADAWQWTPDAIWFDNLRSYGTPNYYVQSLFASNTGTRIIPVHVHAQDGLYTSAVLNQPTDELIVKAVNFGSSARPVEIVINGAKVRGPAKSTTLSGSSLDAENKFDHPKNVSPVQASIDFESGSLAVSLPANSVNIYRIPIQ